MAGPRAAGSPRPPRAPCRPGAPPAVITTARRGPASRATAGTASARVPRPATRPGPARRTPWPTRGAAGAPAPASPASGWFRSRRAAPEGGTGVSRAMGAGGSGAGARPFVTAGQPGGGREGGTGGWAAGRNPADIVAEPARGGETSAGLPIRVPKANLIPGSAADAAPGAGNGRTAVRPGNSQEAQPLPQRSPEMARSRLSGFQRGARRAESQAPRAGEGTDR